MASFVQVRGRWRALIRRKGHPAYCQTFDKRSQAETWARGIEAEIDKGKPPTAAQVFGRQVLLRDMIDEYRRLRAKSRPIASESNEHYTLARLRVWLGDMDVAQMTTDDLIGFASGRKDEGAGPYTVYMDLGKLGTVIKLVSSVMRIPPSHVVQDSRPTLRHLGLIGPGNRRDRRPQGDELEEVVAEIRARRGDIYADAVRFAVITAMRRSEITQMVRADIDVKRKMVMVRNRKHPRQKIGNDMWVPLLHGSWELLQAQLAKLPETQARCWPIHPQTLSKYFREACEKLGIPDLRLHDMRHEGTSRLFEEGYQVHEVAVVTGHKSWKALQIYTQIKPESLHNGPAAKLRVEGKADDEAQSGPPAPSHNG